MTKEPEKGTELPKFIHKPHPEIFIGLVAPLGTDLDTVCDLLSTALKEVSYEPKIIKLSDALRETKDIHEIKLKTKYTDEYYDSFIKAGNAIRSKMERMDALAALAIPQIQNCRKQETGNPHKSTPKTAYILRSLKNEKEIETLKSVYGPAFFLISIYSPKQTRRENLARKIAESRSKPSKANAFMADADRLIETDLLEEFEDFGQEVSKAFPRADLFLEVGHSKTKIKDSITRFVNSAFNYPFHSPTKDEFGMFMAFSAALRSADLSRQVGAAITNIEGDLLTIGCNEVPKYGGGQYWEDDIGDKARDFEIGEDSSVRLKKEVLAETISYFQEEDIGLVTDTREPHEIAEELLHGKHKPKFENADITGLLEYGRIIHAEMATISEAAKRGISLKNATLYCTTFPCHMCARHIISAGIKRVVYVEPYPKSKAEDLYKDSIVVDPPHNPKDKVIFEPFVGISPSRFHDFFKHSKRKENNGIPKKWSTKTAQPRIKIFNDNYIHTENDLTDVVGMTIEDLRAKKSKK